MKSDLRANRTFVNKWASLEYIYIHLLHRYRLPVGPSRWRSKATSSGYSAVSKNIAEIGCVLSVFLSRHILNHLCLVGRGLASLCVASETITRWTIPQTMYLLVPSLGTSRTADLPPLVHNFIQIITVCLLDKAVFVLTWPKCHPL